MNELAAPVSSVALRSYLASRGWRRDGVWRGSSVWSRNRARLLVPENAEYADYDELLLVAVSKLANAENRTTRDVVLDISEPDDDMPSFHLHPDTASGTIPLPLALKSMQGIRDLFKVSAQTVELGAKLHYTGRSSKYVDHFMHRVRIGTTRPGSYIFDARVPIMAAGEPTLDPSLNRELDGRVVMTRLYQATQAAHSAAGEAVERRVFDRFVEAVPIGVSSDLCAALGALGGGARNCCPFDVEFTWAYADADALRPLTVSFDSPRIGAVISAAKVLAEVFRSGRATVTGLVDMLSSSGDELRVRIRGDFEMGSGSNDIDAVVADGSEDADRNSGGHNTPATPVGTVWVALSPEQYQAAIDAHRDKRQLEVHGRLIPDSPRLQIAPDRSGFRVL